MTKKTKIIIGVTAVVVIASIIGYKLYSDNQAKKTFSKTDEEKKSNVDGFGEEIVTKYKVPLWVM